MRPAGHIAVNEHVCVCVCVCVYSMIGMYRMHVQYLRLTQAL